MRQSRITSPLSSLKSPRLANFSSCAGSRKENHKTQQQSQQTFLRVLDIAKIDGLLQRRQRIVSRNKFVRHVALEIGGRDAAHHAVPLHFLRPVEFVTMRNSAGVEMRD